MIDEPLLTANQMREVTDRITNAEAAIRRLVATGRYDDLQPVLDDCDAARQYFARKLEH
jgi:hypothetical protein